MSYSKVIEDLKKLSQNQQPTRVPLFPIHSGGFCERQANVTYRQNRIELEKMVDVSCIGAEKYDYGWAWIFPDDYVEWEPFGVKTNDDENLPVAAIKYLPATPETLNNMVFPDFSQGRMPIHLEAIRRVKERLGDSTAVLGRVAGPFSALSLLFGVEPVLMGLYDKPGFLKEAMAKLSDFIIKWGIAQKEAGADIIWFGDCISRSSFISPQNFSEYVTPFAEKVIKELKKTGVFLIYHASEISIEHLKLEASLSVDAVNVGEEVDIAKLKKQFNKCFTGNFYPIYLRDWEPDRIYEETKNMINDNKKDGRYIFSTAEGITDSTGPENVKAMMEAAKESCIY